MKTVLSLVALVGSASPLAAASVAGGNDASVYPVILASIMLVAAIAFRLTRKKSARA